MGVDEERTPRRVEQAQALKRMPTPANGDVRVNRVGGCVDIFSPQPTIGYANIFGPISPLISMIASAGMLFFCAADRIASGLGAS